MKHIDNLLNRKNYNINKFPTFRKLTQNLSSCVALGMSSWVVSRLPDISILSRLVLVALLFPIIAFLYFVCFLYLWQAYLYDLYAGKDLIAFKQERSDYGYRLLCYRMVNSYFYGWKMLSPLSGFLYLSKDALLFKTHLNFPTFGSVVKPLRITDLSNVSFEVDDYRDLNRWSLRFQGFPQRLIVHIRDKELMLSVPDAALAKDKIEGYLEQV